MAEIHPGRYRHYKGNEYTVLGVARHSETLEEVVVYRQEYGDRGLWVRPAAMFSEMVAIDGKTVPRFTAIDGAALELGRPCRVYLPASWRAGGPDAPIR